MTQSRWCRAREICGLMVCRRPTRQSIARPVSLLHSTLPATQHLKQQTFRCQIITNCQPSAPARLATGCRQKIQRDGLHPGVLAHRPNAARRRR